MVIHGIFMGVYLLEEKTKSNDENNGLINDDQLNEENLSKEPVEDLTDSPSEVVIEDDNNIQELEHEVTKLKQEKSETEEKLLRIHAEFDNYKKRTIKEKALDRKYKSQDLATELLPVLDNFERALQTEISSENNSFKEGMKMIYDQLLASLKSHGVESIDALHQPFDPNYHHAVMQTEDENFEANIVVEQLQKGYVLNDKVIRPAMVKVNK